MRYLTPVLALLAATGLASTAGVQAAQPKDSELLSALRHGGCVILMRHASSPAARPSSRSAAYGRVASALKGGGALIFRPDGRGNAQLLATMQIGDWPRLAAQFVH